MLFRSKNLNNYGRITCYGNNEIALYNWGTVERWSVTERIETHGGNGSGLVNAANIGKITFTKEIETFGPGARGFYMFAGVIKDIHFERILTHGNAACAIQFNTYVDRISISNGIEVFGNTIDVKSSNEIIKMPANAISIHKGGTVKILKVTGDIVTHGNESDTILNEGGVEQFMLSGCVHAMGERSTALKIENGYFAADNVTFKSDLWAAIRLENAKVNNCHNLTAEGKLFDILIDINSSVNRNTFAPEFIEGVFQKDVRLEYIDNIEEIGRAHV